MNKKSDDILDNNSNVAPLTIGDSVSPLTKNIDVPKVKESDWNISAKLSSNIGEIKPNEISSCYFTGYPNDETTISTPLPQVIGYGDIEKSCEQLFLPPNKILTIKEVAEKLKVSAQTVRKLIEKGSLVSVRVSDRVIRVTESDLYAFIESRKS